MIMREAIKRVLIIGAGPVVIGQAAEYDYSGAQACRALRKEGIAVVLLNSNPASLLCRSEYADAVYIEPLQVDVVKRVIALEKPDSILPTMGGDRSLAIALELHNSGYLEENNIRLLSVSPQLIHDVQDKTAFNKMLAAFDVSGVATKIAANKKEAVSQAEQMGYPVLVQPAYTQTSAQDRLCNTQKKLEQAVEDVLGTSSLHQVRITKSIAGWKELEYEVVRDGAGNCICVSNMESLDPVGIHTGDSIVVTPAQTLTDAESEQMRAVALRIASSLDLVGSCNIQIALRPDGAEYAVIEVDPRVSRSSALVSKATGYPIAAVSTLVALGYRLYEIENNITGCTTAASEPAIDYCCVKIPKWSFRNLDQADRSLGTRMYSTGETIAFGTSFELAFIKAIRSSNIGATGAALPKFRNLTDDEVIAALKRADDERIFAIYEALRRGYPPVKIHKITQIDIWFLTKLEQLAQIERDLRESGGLTHYRKAKAAGFLDETIERLCGEAIASPQLPCYKMVDTCAAEFDAIHPYFYAAWDDDNEAQLFQDLSARGKRKVLVVGSGPAAIGQGSELEYCNTLLLQTLQGEGYTALSINNNPQAISTDVTASDRLFLEPLHAEDVCQVIAAERPWAVVLQFAGENALPLLRKISKLPVRVLGADQRMLSLMATRDARKLFLRDIAVPFLTHYPYNATGLEADILYDGQDYLIPGICEHIERSGLIHAGDSISVYPAQSVDAAILREAEVYALKIVKGLGIRGIVNVQYVLFDHKLYVTDIVLGALRNVAFISQATGLPVMELATRCMLGVPLIKSGYAGGVHPAGMRYYVRMPVFSFDKVAGADTRLDSQMKSTGEVMGQGDTLEDALLKALIASGTKIKRGGTVLFSVRDADKEEAIDVADKFAALGYKITATAGTARVFNQNHVPSSSIRKATEPSPNIADLVQGGKCVYIISTSEQDAAALASDRRLRREALDRQIPVFTNLDTARVFAQCLAQGRVLEDMDVSDMLRNRL